MRYADAAMVERVIELDTGRAPAERYDTPRKRVVAAACPDAREIEGIGGQFWYEAVRN